MEKSFMIIDNCNSGGSIGGGDDGDGSKICI